MTLNQIGGIFDRKKFSGVYNLEESSLVKQSIGTVTNYQYDKQTSKWWGSLAVNQEAFCFSTDGSKAYLLSTDTDRIYQYNASVFFDANSLTEDFIYTQLSDVTGTPTSFAYSPDGLRMYVCDSFNRIFQYSLGAAYNLSTLTYVKNATLQAGLNHRQASISADGTKIFFTTITDNWVQSYDLATAWDVATLTYNSTNRFRHIPSGSGNTLQHVTFNPDGSKMYILPSDGRYATQYNLSTPYNLTTATNSVDLLENANLSAVVYDSNGSNVYCMDYSGVIRQYSLGTAYRISTATLVATQTSQFAGSPTTLFRDLKFSSDGTKAYVLNENTNTIYQYSLSTAWDITTLSYSSKSHWISLSALTFSGTSSETSPSSITFKSDGTLMLVMGSNTDFVYQYELGTAWDISTARWGIEMSVQLTQDGLPTDVAFSSDGTKMYVLGDTNNTLYQYTLSNPWDVKTASYASKLLAVGTQDALPVSFRFSSDGTQGYMLGDTNNTVYQYTFSTAWDISTGSYANKSFSIGTQEGTPTGLAFGDSGLKMYVVGTTNDRIYQYNLSTAWDVSTATYSNLSLVISAVDATAQAIAFSSDGTKVVVTGTTSDVIRYYTLSTAWNISTGGLVAGSLSISSFDTTVSGLDFSADGTTLYFIGQALDRVFQVRLFTAWDSTSYSFRRQSLSGISTTIYKIEFDPTGTYLFLASTGQIANQLHRITLGITWGITSGYSGTVSTFTGGWLPSGTTTAGLALSSDGTRLLTGSSRGFAVGLQLTTAWNVASVKLESLSISSNATAIKFNSNGTIFYTNDGAGAFYTHTCTTPYDLNATTYNSSAPLASAVPGNNTTTFFYDFHVNSAGTKLQVLSQVNKFLIEFDRIGTSIFQGSYSIFNQTGAATAMCFNAEGTDLYVAAANIIYQYKLTTPFDLRSVSYYSAYSTASFDSAIKAIDIAPSGASLYIAGDTVDAISEIRMTAPNDITKAYFIDTSPLIGQDGAPGAVRFSTDGTSMYVLGTTNKTIYQYTCSTAFDAKTAVYASKSINVGSFSGSNTTVSDFYFDSTGETAFVCSDNFLQINQFRLATPWDISTAYTPKSVSFATQTGNNASWATFGNNGTKLYLVVTQFTIGYVYQYTLTTPYDITTRVVDKSFISPDTNPTGIQLSDDGTRLFLLGDGNNRIFQYILTTPWDIGNRETFKSLTITGQDSAPQNFVFKPDGTKMYTVGLTNDRIYQYNLATPFDITTTTYDNKFFALPTNQTSPSSLYFRDDGLRVYVWDYDYDRCHEYRLSTAWDISTASWVKNRILNFLNQNARGFAFKPDGTKVYVIDSADNAIYQYSLSTAWDINTLTYENKVFNASAIESGCAGVELSADGTFVYFIGSTNDRIFQYKLNTAWDISTAVSSVKSFSLSGQDSSMQGGAFSWDGLKFYAVGYTNDRVYQYNLSTAWDISTAVYANKFLSIGAQETLAQGLDISDDGTKVYVVGTTNDTVYQYNLSTAYDISTATYSNKSKSVSAQDSDPVGFRISRDGLKAAVLGNTSDRVYYYTLATAWDISTMAVTASSGLVSTQELSPTGLFVAQGSGETGTKLFVVGDGSDKVNRYTTAAWSASTFTYQSGLSSNDYSSYTGNAVDVMMSVDGDKMYVIGLNNTVYQFDVAAPNEANTANMGYTSITSLESVPEKIRFNNDGTKLFLMGSGGDDINVFTLPSNAPWIASAAVYTSVSGSITDTVPYGMTIKPDGSRYYTCGTNDVIRQWTPSSNYGTSLTSTGTADISPTLLDPKDIAFSSDGLKLFVLGDTTIYEYSVEMAWETNAINTQWKGMTDAIVRSGAWSSDGLKCFTLGDNGDVIHVQTATYPWNLASLGSASTFISLGLSETNGRGLYLKPDGSKLYLIGLSLDSVVEYSMTNYTLPVNTGKQANIGWETPDPTGLAFSSDGTSFYTISNAGAIRQFKLDTPWEISSAFVPSTSYTGDNSPYSMFIGDSGNKAFITGISGDTLITYALAAPWNIGNLTLLRTYSGINSEGIVTGHVWKPDGLKFFTTGQAIDEIREYTLTTAWNTSTASYSGKRIELLRVTASSIGDPIGLLINNDGTRLYTTPAGTGTMYSLELTNGYDLNSFAHGGIYLGAFDSTFRNVCFNGTGTRMYIAGRTNDSLIQFNLASAFRLTSAVSASKSVSISSADGNVQGIDCNPDASKFYIMGSFNTRVNEFSNSLSTGELGTLTLSATSIPLIAYEGTPLGVSVNNSGKTISIIGSGSDRVWQFELTTGYNINSWDTRRLSIASQEPNVRGIALSPDGYKLFVYGTAGVIFQYNLPLSMAISFATYSGKFLYVGSVVGGFSTPTDISFAHNGLYFYLLDGQTNASASVQRYGLLGF